jgi:hypothetical protein
MDIVEDGMSNNDKESSEECFVPQSAACRGSIKTDDPAHKVMLHITHLEKDHGMKLVEEEGRLRLVEKH